MENTERRADRTRAEMVEAGWDLLDGLTLAEAVGSLSAARVATAAGRSERTFWNHFPDWSAYLEALMDHLPRRGPMVPEGGYGPVDAVRAALEGGDPTQVPSVVAAAAAANWAEVTRPAGLKAYRAQLLFASRGGADPGVGRMLADDYYGFYLPALVAVYEATVESLGVAPLAPLSMEHFARILAAVSEGLLLQSLAEPDSVTEDLVTEATTLVALGLLAPDDAPETVAERKESFGVATRPVALDDELLAIAARCRSALDKFGAEVRWAQLVEPAGIDGTELRRRFQRVSMVAALAFADHLDQLGPEPGSPTRPPDPAVDWLCRLTRVAREAHLCARALLNERLDPRDGSTLATLVPLGGRLAAELGERRRPVHERIVNVALGAALSDDSASPAHVAHVALATHPGWTGIR